jgi:hypothetical protein
MMKKLFITLMLVACVASTLMIAGCTSTPPQIVPLPTTTVATPEPTTVATTAPIIMVTPTIHPSVVINGSDPNMTLTDVVSTTIVPNVTYTDTSNPNVVNTSLGTTVPVINETPVINMTPTLVVNGTNTTPVVNTT